MLGCAFNMLRLLLFFCLILLVSGNVIYYSESNCVGNILIERQQDFNYSGCSNSSEPFIKYTAGIMPFNDYWKSVPHLNIKWYRDDFCQDLVVDSKYILIIDGLSFEENKICYGQNCTNMNVCELTAAESGILHNSSEVQCINCPKTEESVATFLTPGLAVVIVVVNILFI